MKRTLLSVAVLAVASMGALGCQTEFVTPVTTSSILVQPQEADILEGEDIRFTATVIDEFDQPVPSAVVTWSTDDSSIVRVDADGRAWGLAPGATLVQASFNGTAGSALMTVEPVFTCGSGAPKAGKPKDEKDEKRKKSHNDDDEDDDDDDDDDDEDDDDDPRCAPTAGTGT